MSEVELNTYINEIATMIESSSYDVAIAHCKHILARYPKYIEAYRLIGKAALEKEDHATALDIFQRVLAADPEDFVARVGMSIIYDRQGDMDKAIWHMERAYDLMPSNGVIQGELKRLYAHRDGVEPTRISLTRGALARMYAQGDLYPEAIADINQMLQEQPDRLDLQVLLTQVLWRNDQRIEAADWAQKILKRLPYCLTSNLILGEVWRANDQNLESEVPLRRAQQIDPENSFAAKFFGVESPLPKQIVMIDRFEVPYTSEPNVTAPSVDEVPDWLRGLSEVAATPQIADRQASPQLPTGLHMPGTGPLDSHVPEWLQGLAPAAAEATESPAASTPPATAEPESEWLAQMRTVADASKAAPPQIDESTEVPDWLSTLGATPSAVEEGMPSLPSSIESETPDWLSHLADVETSLPSTQPSSEADMPDWLSKLGSTETSMPPGQPAGEVELPDWLSNLGGTEASVVPAQPSSEAEMPDWLRQLGTRPLGLESTSPAVEPAAEMPDWLANLKSPMIDSQTTSASEEPDWLKSINRVDDQPLTKVTPVETTPAPTEVPEEMSSPEDALAFLTKLSVGKEDQLRVQTDEEAAVRMNEIMRQNAAQPTEPSAPSPPIVAAQSNMVEASPAPLEVPEEMTSPEDALAFLARLSAGKEDQLRAQAEEEAAVRMNEIMGRKAAPPAEKPVEQPKPTQPPARLEPAMKAPAEKLIAQFELEQPAKPAATPESPGPTLPVPAASSVTAIPDILQGEASAFVQQVAEDKESGSMQSRSTQPVESAQSKVETEPELVEPISLASSVESSAPVAVDQPSASTGQTAPPVVLLPAWWWTQVAEDEDEEPIAELPEPYYSMRAAAPAAVTASAVPFVKRDRQPVREVAVPRPGTGPIAMPPVKKTVNVEPLLARLQTSPNDHEARLELARAWWSSGNRDQALEHYSILVASGVHTDETLNDLERIIEIDDRPDWQRLLGDVCMKSGKLTRALEAYHHALEKL